MAQDAGKVPAAGMGGGGSSTNPEFVSVVSGVDPYAPSDVTANTNKAVTVGAVTGFTVVAGRRYLIWSNVEVCWGENVTPTASLGSGIPPNTLLIAKARNGGAFNFTATTVAGRVSVHDVT